MVECGGLLNRCTGKTVPGVRIPPAPVLLIVNDLQKIKSVSATISAKMFPLVALCGVCLPVLGFLKVFWKFRYQRGKKVTE